MKSNTIVKVKGLTKEYRTNKESTKALDNVSLSIKKGEFLAIVGTSGSGKSTLLHMLGGLDKPTEGVVTIGEKDIFSMNKKDLTIFRREQIGFVFQNYNLLPVLDVYDNIAFPVELAKKKPDYKYIEMLMKILGISERRRYMPTQLSGGQQQRVSIARALVMKPKILLADEPTGNLDSKNTKQVMDLFRATSEQFNQTIVLITHDKELAARCDRIITLEDGRIISDSSEKCEDKRSVDMTGSELE